MNVTFTPKLFVAVRWPFRVLAALFLASMVVAYGCVAISLWQGHHIFGSIAEGLLLQPFSLWFGRLCYFAAATGSMPRSGNGWPFATEQLFNIYLLFLTIFLLTR
jgi:hypothetical protein